MIGKTGLYGFFAWLAPLSLNCSPYAVNEVVNELYGKQHDLPPLSPMKK